MVLKIVPTDMSSIIKSVLESQNPRAAAKDQSISFAPPTAPVMLETDASAMTQVVDNLVSNAIKYSPKGKSILVQLLTETDSVRVEVKDEGPGLSEEDQKKLFGKFARLSAKPTAGEQSIGLGLSIVKRMVETLNGQIRCETTLGQGATFIAPFPL